MMIDKIYKVIADKSLTQWCKIDYYEPIDDYWNWFTTQYIIGNIYMFEGEDSEVKPMIVQVIDYIRDWWYETEDQFRSNMYPITIKDIENDHHYDVIWHPVMLWTVLDRYEKLPHAEVYTDNSLVIVKAWKDKRKPIEEQPDTLIEYIYNLLP